MALPATIPLSDPSYPAALARALGRLNVIYAQDELLSSADLALFSAQRGNWISPPAPVVLLNGAPATGITLNQTAGTVTFSPAAQASDIVTATYTANVYVAADFTAFLTEAFYRLEGILGGSLDDTQLARLFFPYVVSLAFIACLRALSGERLDNYLWEIDGKKVDRRAVATTFLAAIREHEALLQTDLAYLRAQFMDAGYDVQLRLDRGLPPNHYSEYPYSRGRW